MSKKDTRTYRFGGIVVEAAASLSPEDVKVAWGEVYPGIENAEIQELEDGSVEFVTRAGTKG